MKVWSAGQLIAWRWSSLVNVCKALLDREKGLRLCWSLQALMNSAADRTAEDEDRDQDTSQAAQIFRQADQSVTSPFFWAYTRFLAITHGNLEKISGWCESCPCHPIEVPCKLKGRRCPELADGCFERFMLSMHRAANADFLAAAAGLPPKELAILQQDFTVSCDLIFTESRLKTAHWSGALPWAICGIASDSEKRAREAATLLIIQLSWLASQLSPLPKI